MYIYIFYFVVVSFLSLIMVDIKKTKQIYIIMCSFLFFVIFGFRVNELGTDTKSYLSIFENSTEVRDPIFTILVKISHILEIPPYLSIALISFTIVFLILKSYSLILDYRLFALSAIFLSVSYILYSFNFNILRQGLAVSIGAFSFALYLNNKKILALLFYGVSVFAHASMIVLIIPLIISRCMKKSSWTIFIIGMIIYVFFTIENGIISLKSFESLIPAERFSQLMRLTTIYNKGVTGVFFSYSTVLFPVFYMVWLLVREKSDLLDKYKYDVLFNVYFFTFVIVSPLSQFHLLYYRLLWTVSIFEPLMCSLIFSAILPRMNKYQMLFIGSALSFVYLFKTYFITGGMLNEVSYGTILF